MRAGHVDPKTQREDRPIVWEREGAKRKEEGFGSSFYMFLSLGLSYVNWAGQECCWFYLRFSLQSSDLPLFYFRGLSLPGLLATAILDIFSLF